MKIQTITSIPEMRKAASEFKGRIGFVPTMGYFHQGHLSLVESSQRSCDHTIVSIYVNPAQFGPGEDLTNYPRDIRKDIEKLGKYDVDYVFLPDDALMYPQNYKTWVSVDEITDFLCGKSRPTHFKGVTTIVAKLLNIINPDKIFLGEKDYQQLIVIRKMVADLNMNVEVIGCPLIREDDGLAMSSRNKYLSEKERDRAVNIYRSLKKAQAMFAKGIKDSESVTTEIKRILLDSELKIDYIEIVNPNTLRSETQLSKGCRILIAAYSGKTRLIDNLEIK